MDISEDTFDPIAMILQWLGRVMPLGLPSVTDVDVFDTLVEDDKLAGDDGWTCSLSLGVWTAFVRGNTE
jgi:hypothetical protein